MGLFQPQDKTKPWTQKSLISFFHSWDELLDFLNFKISIFNPQAVGIWSVEFLNLMILKFASI